MTPGKTIDEEVEAAQHDQGNQKNDPAFQAMEEAARQFRVDFTQDAGDGHAA
jgi:hypothetical protein